MHHCVPILDNGGKGLLDQMVLGGSSGPALTMKGNMSKRGWWKIDYTIEPNEIDLEHIAEEIKKGNDQGEIIQEDEA